MPSSRRTYFFGYSLLVLVVLLTQLLAPLAPIFAQGGYPAPGAIPAPEAPPDPVDTPPGEISEALPPVADVPPGEPPVLPSPPQDAMPIPGIADPSMLVTDAITVSVDPIVPPEDQPILPEVLPELAEEIPLGVQLLTSQEELETGDTLVYTVTVGNHGEDILTDVIVSDTLPAGAAYVSESAEGFTFNSAEQRLEWVVPPLEPGTMLTGSFEVQAQEIVSETVINQVDISAPALEAPAELWTVAYTEAFTPNQAIITPDGGLLHAEATSLDVVFPPDAVEQPVIVRLGDAPIELPPLTNLLEVFELNAETLGATSVTTFTQPLALVANLAGYETLLTGPDTPGFYWLNEVTQEWEAITTTVSWEMLTAEAQVDHFSTYALAASSVEPSYGRSATPTLKGISADEFTGNSSFHYPLDLPPGPGEFGINLSLNYSSELVNSLRAGYSPPDEEGVGPGYRIQQFMQQANTVGWGWHLGGLGSITRSYEHSIYEIYNPENKPHLNFAGGSYDLIPAGPNEWRTVPESFFRVRDTSTSHWQVWTPDGTRYTFGGDLESQAVAYDVYYPLDCHAHGQNGRRFREAQLVEVLDPNGNKVVIDYARTQQDPDGDPNIAWGCPEYTRATRPMMVRYFPANSATDTVRVDFSYAADRHDTNLWGRYWKEGYYTYWTDHRLMDIHVKVRNGTAATSFQIVRSYHLDHDEDGWTDPDPYNSATSYRAIMRLTKIWEHGSDGAQSPAPAWTFTYYKRGSTLPNENLLRQATSVYGGSVEYTYLPQDDSIPIEGVNDQVCSGSHNTSRFRVTHMAVKDGLSLNGVENVTTTTYDTSAAHARARGWGAGCSRDFEFGGYRQMTRSVRGSGEGQDAQRIVSHFHQLDTLNGKPDYQSVLDPVTLQEMEVTDWQWVDADALGTASNWARLDWQATARNGVGTRTVYSYDSYGNVIQEEDQSYFGTTGNRYRRRNIWYSLNLTDYIINLPYQIQTRDSALTCKSDTRLYYDNWHINGATPGVDNATYPGKTQLTRQQIAEGGCDVGPWITTEYRHDIYGNVIQVSNPYYSPLNQEGTPTGVTLVWTNTYYDTSSPWPRLYALPTIVDPPAINATRFVWDKSIIQVQTVTDSLGLATEYRYDAWGRLSKMWKYPDNDQQPTKAFTYDAYVKNVRPFRVTTTQRTWDGVGTNTNVYQTAFYDGLGREVQTRQRYVNYSDVSVQAVTFTRYNALGQIWMAYSPVEEAINTTNPNPYTGYSWNLNRAHTETTYDGLGRTTAVYQPDCQVGHAAYPTDCTYQWWNYKDNFSYNSHLVAYHDSKHGTVHYHSDVFGRMWLLRNFSGSCPSPTQCSVTLQSMIHYGFNWRDQLTHVIPKYGTDPPIPGQAIPNANITISYDFLGRKTDVHDPDIGRAQYGYDLAGNLIKQLDSRGQGICFAHDVLNRLEAKHYPSTLVSGGISGLNCPSFDTAQATYQVQYTYNPYSGNRSRMDDPSGYTTWSYDARGRMISERKTVTGSGTFATSWGYDSMDRSRRIQYPADNLGNLGETVTYTYPHVDLVEQGGLGSVSGDASVGNVSYASDMRYNSLGQLRRVQYGSGTATTSPIIQRLEYYALTTQNGLGRPSAIKAGTSTFTNLQYLAYRDSIGNPGYDAAGNITDIINYWGTDEVQHFDYDYMNRLWKAQSTSTNSAYAYGPEEYLYDEYGNVRTRGAHTLTYGLQSSSCPSTALNKPHAMVTNTLGNSTYCYDRNGNRQQHTEYRSNVKYKYDYDYDAENRLTSVMVAYTENGWNLTNALGSWVYDGDGNRVKATETGATTVYIGDYAEWETSGSTGTLTKYYYAAGRRIAMRRGSTAPEWILGDHLGSTSLRVDQAGTVVPNSEVRYKPFGLHRYPATLPSDAPSRLFTGQVRDTGTGLYFYGSRYYDPLAGQFIQPDSIVPDPQNPLAFNRYSYVYNNPLKYTDSTGYCADQDHACWQKEWNDKDVWYRAHGYHWDPRQGLWTLQPGKFSEIADVAMADRILAEYGVVLDGNWSPTEKIAIAMGVADLGAAVGGAKQFGKLMGGTVTIRDRSQRPYHGCFWGGGCAPAPWVPGSDGRTIWAYGTKSVDRYWTVHELAHVIDWNSSIRYTLTSSTGMKTVRSGIFSDAWAGAPTTSYGGCEGEWACVEQWENWAEAVTTYVYGNTAGGDYKPRRQLTAPERDIMRKLLEGRGW